MTLKEYTPGTAFPGVIGRTFDVSQPAWPRPLRATPGAPNVLFIVQDDTGFGQLGCYGAPIKTPNLDALAANGLLFNNMHTTALCSPSRSCILTGRNHHSNAMSCITEGSTGYPGGNGNIPFENGMLSEMLLQQGYNTYALGKWHLTPTEQGSAAGPYDRWPLGRGFERYYGFLGGDTHQYYPELVYDNHSVEPEKSPEEGYHLTEDLTDKAIAFIADAKQIAPNKPFSSTSVPAQPMPRTTFPRNGRTNTRVSLTTAGMLIAPRCSSARGSWGSFRKRQDSLGTIQMYRTGTVCRPARRSCTRA
jgi:arylsulfatase